MLCMWWLLAAVAAKSGSSRRHRGIVRLDSYSLPRVIGGPWGTWVAAVEDHQLRLEDTEQQMDLREQEDAANEVIKDANALSREEAKCDVCGKVASPTPDP